MIHGINILLTINGAVVGAMKSCSLTFDAEVMEVSSPTTGTFKQYIVGRKSWKLSSGYLVTTVKTNLMKVGTSVTVKFGVRDDSQSDHISTTDFVTGTAIVTACRIDGTVGSLATGSFEFVGSGTLS